MGMLLKFIFYSLLLTWIYNQLIRPFMDGQSETRFRQPPTAPPKREEPSKKEVEIEYRKFRDGDGEYVDYEEIKEK